MTAIVILNIFFAVLVVVGMLTLLGRAIVTDARATGQRLTPAWRTLRLRPPARAASQGWSGRVDPVAR